ncbi:MAG: hypothetical protein A3C50_01180 [Candidatus Staskawiczbacteria bacterium RIFCSPHIGHO2_02_FULL_43_16]|uniref:Uncharacterized protein n=1 Tax=Candidatus Staskawiczbacteria bacterium RIFCSPHIGHO2_01_FULL_41_41 TaxID=1802203 RepID=A0A1G2HV47_9BACT|nr:MAG: hypothetical protein A2822_04735 [Candidatus Staskawiczbacteria bacterium RIFCSPHIGHO2_01_FULL_41_41]OGZ68822.1 MAG: hypothetical protein A3C50_01180 [Candidatus Staskawiczbacteria bacterium RIFCSPHIGHO2_02_FULL_43_16]OGZ74195.1 MAG: hypothetical protein A3A12_00170 [Candidatus Staskawiczbacteria bacterium RIFCSPLOWO2_01_FULL_43_17b]
MNSHQKYFTVGFVFFLVGILAGQFLKDIPYLTLDPSVSPLEVANLFVGIAIAFLIPFTVKKYIEDKKDIKSFLVDEFKELIATIHEVKAIIAKARSANIFTADNRNDIRAQFHESELKVNSITEQLKIAFVAQSPKTEAVLKELLWKYDHYITGGELMNSSFTAVDERFFRESNIEYSKMETGLKKLIHEVYKF